MDNSHVLVVGAAGLDTKGRADGPLQPDTSNPGRIRIGVGGVARNVAENLARLGEHAILLSAVGDDRSGLRIREQALDAGAEVLATSCPYCISNFEESCLSLGEEPPLLSAREAAWGGVWRPDGTLLMIVYFWRLIEIMYIRPTPGGGTDTATIQEAPYSMRVPCMTLGILTFAVGIGWLSGFITPVLDAVNTNFGLGAP